MHYQGIQEQEILWTGCFSNIEQLSVLNLPDVDNGNKVTLASPDVARFIRILGEMQGPVWELFFSPDGSLLAATNGIGIHIWQVEDGKLLYIGKAACP